MCTCLSQCLRLVVKQKSVIALCKVISMGQTSSKKPKDLPKRGSVNSQQSTPVENVRKISVFDHVMDQIVESSVQYAPVADPPDVQYANKIHEKAFVEILFSLPNEVDGEHHLQKLGSRWFHKAVIDAHGGHQGGEWLDRNALLKACDRHHGIIDDQLALSTYLYLYADESGKHLMAREDVQAFLELSLFLYMLDSWNSEETKENTGQVQVQGIVDGLFNDIDGNEPKEARQVLKYFEQNIPNCAQHIHKFVLFRLVKGSVIGGVFTNRVVLDVGNVDPTSFRQSLDKFKVWQLAALLPAIPFFKSPVVDSKPGEPQKQNSNPPSRRPSYYLSAPFGKDSSSQCLTIATWQLLYNSDAHGVGTNRFLHHVLGYRGPTVMVVLTKDPKTSDILEFVFAQSLEWKEGVTTAFTDKLGCAAEMRYQFKSLGRQRVTPWIYYNMSTQRGVKKGLFLGEPGETPMFSLDDSFDNATYNKRALHVLRIEVWGCGTPEERTRQLDVKKWEVKEAEKQRVVKLSADDWLDHPDRYLLEMSGRQSYVTQKEGKK